MAYDLKALERPNRNRPVIITIAGEAGMGKTTRAASFPKPVMIRVEDGAMSISGLDVAMFPMATSSNDVFEQITSLATNEHDFKTLIIDSITQLNTMIEAEIIASDPKKPKGINQAFGGYGNGFGAVSSVHAKLREWCGGLSITKGMNIVFIAHADSETVEPPDMDNYTRYTLRMHKKSVAHYVDNVDAIAFIALKQFTTGQGDKKKAISNGERVIKCTPNASSVAKNRFGIDTDLEFIKGQNPFAQFLTNGA
jgi:hypothetical protein